MLSLPNRTLERSSASIASLELGRQEGSAVHALSSAWTIAAVAIASVIAVPSLAVLVSLAHPAREVWAHLWRTQLLELIGNTLALLAGVGAGTLVVGAGLAWLVVTYRFPGRAVLEWALVLPLAVPAYVIGFAFLGLFDFTGPVQGALRRWTGTGVRLPELRSYWGVVLMMTLVFYPYVYLLARAAFREQGAATLETARSLGRSRMRAFIEVTLPLARPSVTAGVSLAMMEALADFGTVATFGYRTLTEAVYRVWYGMFDRTAAAQVASLLLLLALGLLVLERSLRGRARFTQSQRRGPGVTPLALAGWKACAATGTGFAILAFAFVLPVVQLIVWARDASGRWRASSFVTLLGNTLVLAALAAMCALVLALVLAYATRLHPSALVRASARAASMGYALPGAVIAVGVLVPLAWLDRAVGHAAGWAFGHSAGLVLTGSTAGLLFAYVARFLSVSFQTLEASLTKIPANLDDAARSLGASIGGTLRRIHLPLMRGGVLTAMIVVFVETMKEMPATLLLRPLGLDTLAIAVWERTSESLWADAAAPALAIVAAGLVPVLVVIRLSARRY
jgi:iron(III) transport system permease protein